MTSPLLTHQTFFRVPTPKSRVLGDRHLVQVPPTLFFECYKGQYSLQCRRMSTVFFLKRFLHNPPPNCHIINNSRTAHLDDCQVIIPLLPPPLHDETTTAAVSGTDLHPEPSKPRRDMFETRPSIPSPIFNFPHPIQEDKNQEHHPRRPTAPRLGAQRNNIKIIWSRTIYPVCPP